MLKLRMNQRGEWIPEPQGLGDRLALFLYHIGIRKWKGCGCAKRQAWLNAAGLHLQNYFNRIKNKAL